MRRVEGSNFHARKKERNLLEDANLVVLDAPRDIVVTQQSPHQSWRAVDAHVLVRAHQFVGIPDVIGMVMREQNAFHF